MNTVIPATIGMSLTEVDTPALLVDLAALVKEGWLEDGDLAEGSASDLTDEGRATTEASEGERGGGGGR